MKRILFTTVSLGVLALGSQAAAADLPVKAGPAPVPVYDWSGFYVGGFGGYAFGNQNLNNALGPAGFANFTTNWETLGAFGGGEIGYNWQSGNIVFGIEADGAGSNIQGRDNFALTDVNGLPMDDFNKLKWVASLRARGGIAVDRLLLFFDGGWAVWRYLKPFPEVPAAVETRLAARCRVEIMGGAGIERDEEIGAGVDRALREHSELCRCAMELRRSARRCGMQDRSFDIAGPNPTTLRSPDPDRAAPARRDGRCRPRP